jgi:hypothetical protein
MKRTEESKQKMREAYKKYKEENPEEFAKRYITRRKTLELKSEEEKQVGRNNQSIALQKAWVELKKDEKKMIERSKKISEKISGENNHMKRPEMREFARKRMIGHKMSLETKILRAENLQKKIDAGINTGIRCKYFEVHGLKCQGKTEEWFVNYLYDNNMDLPLKRGEFITTELGVYHPDFQMSKNEFVEIKSLATLKIFNGLMNDMNFEFSVRQRNKIIEACTKQEKIIRLIVIKNKEIIGEFIFDKTFSFEKYNLFIFKMLGVQLENSSVTFNQ